MADISAEIAAFQNAVYGEDVRSAMVSLANKVNNESSDAASTVSGYDTRLTKIENTVSSPFSLKNFIVNANSQHYGVDDSVPVNIKMGENFSVDILVFSDNTPPNIFVIQYFSDNTNTSSMIHNNEHKIFTASKDIIKIGIYTNNITSSDVNIYLVVSINPVAYELTKLLGINTGSGILAQYLPSNSDANSLDANMTLYSFGSSNRPSNIPSGISSGHIINYIGANAECRVQILYDSSNDAMYYRTFFSQWQDWKKVKTDDGDQILNLITNSLYAYPTPLHRLYSDNGTYVNHNQYNCSELIPVEIPVEISFDVNIPSGYHALICYDADYNVVDTDVTNVAATNVVYTITNTSVVYVRFQGRNLSFLGNTIDPVIRIPSSINNRLLALESQSSDKIYLTKTSANAFNIKVPCYSGNVVRYDYIHDTKVWDSLEYLDSNGNTQTAINVKSSDYWNNYYVYNDTDNTYLAQGHSNFIINKDGHFSGDGHGNEVNLSFVIIADGKEININDIAIGAIIPCGDMRIIVKTQMLKAGVNTGSDIPSKAYPELDVDGNPIIDFIHCMEIVYHIGNIIEMHNKLIVQHDNTIFNSCFGAMLECNYGDFDTVIVNDEENTQNNIASDGTCTASNGSSINLRSNPYSYANVVEMFGENHYIRQSMFTDKLSSREKQAIYFEFYTNRLKCYFAPVVTTSRYPAGHTPDTFNAGDVISVTNERVISI